MWLYVPQEYCPSAPESERSNLESGSQTQEPELFVMSSGKPTLRPLSWRGFRTRSWIELLAGTTSRPSTASRGVEKWISLLEAFRVSRLASRENRRERKTLVTSGQTSPALSERCRLLYASSKMSQTSSTKGSKKYVKSFGEWITALKQEYTARRKSEPRSSESGSSSSPAGKKSWPTPTPAARDHKGAADWSKRTRDGKQRKWSDMTLPDAVGEMWPTPVASSYGSNRGGAKGRVGPVRHSLRALASMSGGEKCRMILNPRFVEVLQGLPPGLTDCGSSATASFRKWLARHGFRCGKR